MKRRDGLLLVLSLAAAGAPGPAAAAESYVEFFRAVNIDHVAAVKALLARGFDPNAADERGQTGLHLAVRDEAPRVAAALLAHPGIQVDALNAAGETPLMLAALKGDIDGMSRLVQRGAAVNRSGWTPLHYAASGSDSTTAVAWLLDRGAAIDPQAANGNTPLMMASRHGAWASAELLLLRGADARLTNRAGQTAADQARQADRDALARKLEQAAR